MSAACVTTVSGSATAKGCAYTAAYAEATAEAYAVAHAEAAAAASTQCSCGKDFVAVYADAAAVIVLWAEAHAAATAAACAQGALPTISRMRLGTLAWVPAEYQALSHSDHCPARAL